MTDDPETTERLFSYGTLQLHAVQVSTFGRPLQGHADTLEGYALSSLPISDLDVVRTSGQTHHPIIVPTGRGDDRIEGTVFRLTRAELARADDYEVDDYERIAVVLASGVEAWVYAQPT